MVRALCAQVAEPRIGVGRRERLGPVAALPSQHDAETVARIQVVRRLVRGAQKVMCVALLGAIASTLLAHAANILG